MSELLSMLIGILLRLGIPIGISILVFHLLRRLDARWQKQANILPVVAAGQKPCWEVKNCAQEKQKTCPAAQHPDIPCWHTFRSKEGILRDACLDCSVFSQTMAPVRA